MIHAGISLLQRIEFALGSPFDGLEKVGRREDSALVERI